MTSLRNFIVRLFTIEATSSNGNIIVVSYIPMLILGAIAATPIIKNIFAKKQDSIVVRYSKIIVCSVLFVLCVAALANQSYNPFIYFRF